MESGPPIFAAVVTPIGTKTTICSWNTKIVYRVFSPTAGRIKKNAKNQRTTFEDGESKRVWETIMVK